MDLLLSSSSQDILTRSQARCLTKYFIHKPARYISSHSFSNSLLTHNGGQSMFRNWKLSTAVILNPLLPGPDSITRNTEHSRWQLFCRFYAFSLPLNGRRLTSSRKFSFSKGQHARRKQRLLQSSASGFKSLSLSLSWL